MQAQAAVGGLDHEDTLRTRDADLGGRRISRRLLRHGLLHVQQDLAQPHGIDRRQLAVRMPYPDFPGVGSQVAEIEFVGHGIHQRSMMNSPSPLAPVRKLPVKRFPSSTTISMSSSWLASITSGVSLVPEMAMAAL